MIEKNKQAEKKYNKWIVILAMAANTTMMNIGPIDGPTSHSMAEDIMPTPYNRYNKTMPKTETNQLDVLDVIQL